MILTGIKPTGTFHIGNFISTIKPILNKDAIILIADQHALISNPKNLKENIIDLYRIFLSFGFKNIVRQSELPEISELNWILSCCTEIGHLNRSHAYKSTKDFNVLNNFNENKGITAGLFNYPTLMAADNIIFDTEYVSIGQDQVSHIEIAKFIANKFNHIYNTDILKVPKPVISNDIILGYDGRKMSKSYNNVIPLFCSEKKLKKHIFSMKTNSKNIGEPKFMNESPVCDLFNSISSDEQKCVMKNLMEDGIGWGDIKLITFDLLNGMVKNERDIYNNSFNGKPTYVETYNRDTIFNVKKKIEKIKHLVY